MSDEKKCPACGDMMSWEICEALDCDDGYDLSDCLGVRKCYMCCGDGGRWFCQNCAAKEAEELANENLI